MTHTDIREESWIQLLPQWVRPYALLMRLDRPIGWWLLLFPGWWAIILASGGVQNMVVYHWCLFILFFIGAIIMRGAGCIINDLWDRDLDAQVERTKDRPLASGKITKIQASFLLFFLLFFGLIILLQTSGLAILLGIVSVFFVICYPYMKRITWWPQAFLGITFNFSALIGWTAVTNQFSWLVIILYMGCFFWTLGYDTIYAHQDKDDDALVGIKSTARLFAENSKDWVAIFYTFSWCLLCVSCVILMNSFWSVIFLIPAAIHMKWQITTWNLEDHNSSLAIFKSNRNFGLLVVLGILMGSLIPV